MYIKDLVIYAINIVLFIIEVFLGARLILKVLGANTEAPFVSWLYATTEPLLAPFAGMFPSPVLEEGIVIEFSTLFAMVVYALAGYLLVQLIHLIGGAAPRRRRNDREDY